MDTLAEYTPGSESASSLMVFDRDERRTRARKPVGEGFGSTPLPGSSEQAAGPATGGCGRRRPGAWLLLLSYTQVCLRPLAAEEQQRSSILALRRRFLKDRRNASLAYAQKEIQHQRRKKVASMELQSWGFGPFWQSSGSS